MAGVRIDGFDKLEAKLTKNLDLSKVKATVKKTVRSCRKRRKRMHQLIQEI